MGRTAMVSVLLLGLSACVSPTPACPASENCITCTGSGSCIFCFETNQCIAADGFCAGDVARRPDQCASAREATLAGGADAAIDDLLGPGDEKAAATSSSPDSGDEGG